MATREIVVVHEKVQTARVWAPSRVGTATLETTSLIGLFTYRWESRLRNWCGLVLRCAYDQIPTPRHEFITLVE